MAALVRAAATRAVSAGRLAVPLGSRGLKMALPQRKEESSLSSSTGTTGAAVLGLGLAAFLASKEILILHNETIVVASIGAVTYGLFTKAGKDIAGELDNRANSIREQLISGREARMAAIEQEIAEQRAVKDSVADLTDIFDANRAVAEMSRELAYREELHGVRNAAEAELSEVLSIEQSLRAQEQADIAAWIENEVVASLKGQEDALMKESIAELEALAN